MAYSTNTKDEENKRGKKAMGMLPAAVLAFGALVLGASAWTGGSEKTVSSSIPTYTVEPGDLSVTVSAGGTVQAMETTEIECQVEGQTQILDIVDQGTVLTQEDVENERVIVKLDSSSLEDSEEQQEIEVANAEASYTSAQESLNIQKQQNESNISQAELDVEIARMDLEKYVGKELVDEVVNENVHYQNLGQHEALGGEAQVTRDDLQSQISLAKAQLKSDEETLTWTRRLLEKEYVSENELDSDELQVKRRKSELEQAKANLRLFREYTLPKQVKQYASDLREAKRELKRVKARARSQLAQAESDLRSKKSTYEMKKERLEELRTMIDNCTIEAPKPGLVVYASTSRGRRFDENPIEEGRELREGQPIITIPDLETMSAQVNIPESDIQSVEEGQRAVVTVEAVPDKTWEGEVAQVSSMASEEDRFGPDASVYESFVKLDGRVTKLKPGMSATAEIYVADKKDVLTVPIQAVTSYEGDRVVWTRNSDELALHEVNTGQFSDTKVEIQAGLEEGDTVLLAPPEVEPANVKLVELPESQKQATKVAEGPDNEGGPGRPSQRGPGGGSAQAEPPQDRSPGSATGGGQRPRRGQSAGTDGENQDGPGDSGPPMNPDRVAKMLKQMPEQRRKAAIKRMRDRMSSLSEEKRKKMKRVLSQFESADGQSNE